MCTCTFLPSDFESYQLSDTNWTCHIESIVFEQEASRSYSTSLWQSEFTNTTSFNPYNSGIDYFIRVRFIELDPLGTFAERRRFIIVNTVMLRVCCQTKSLWQWSDQVHFVAIQRVIGDTVRRTLLTLLGLITCERTGKYVFVLQGRQRTGWLLVTR